jgi:hypothetical protein
MYLVPIWALFSPPCDAVGWAYQVWGTAGLYVGTPASFYKELNTFPPTIYAVDVCTMPEPAV